MRALACLLAVAWGLGAAGCAFDPAVPDNGAVPSPCVASTPDCGQSVPINWTRASARRTEA